MKAKGMITCNRCERTAYLNETEDVLGYTVCRECKPKLTLGEFIRLHKKKAREYVYKSFEVHARAEFTKQLMIGG